MRTPEGAELPERQRAEWMAHKPAALDLAECCWTAFDVMLLMSPRMPCASQRAHRLSRRLWTSPCCLASYDLTDGADADPGAPYARIILDASSETCVAPASALYPLIRAVC